MFMAVEIAMKKCLSVFPWGSLIRETCFDIPCVVLTGSDSDLLFLEPYLCLLVSKVTALECLEAMASGLYSEVFTLVISLINRLDFTKSPNMIFYHF